MKNIKKIFSLVICLLLLATLASCKKEETRNTVVPYGSLDLNSTVATAKDDSLSLSMNDFYSRLRYKGADIFNSELKKIVYADELEALKALIASSSIADLSAEELSVLSYKSLKDSAAKINEAEYNELKEEYTEEISNSVLSSIFSTNDFYTISALSNDEKNVKIAKYIESNARKNIVITADEIKYADNDNDEVMDLNVSLLPQAIIDSVLSTKAEYLYAQKELYTIADLEYIYDEEEDTETSNNFYLFEEDKLISTYDNSYKTFGKYKAIIITYNSRREAMNSINALGTDVTADSYLTLYNNYYSCYGTQTIDSEKFEYVVDIKNNDLSDISSSVSTLITETLEDGDFLTEPRNLNGKYVLAYRISTTYDYEEKEFDELEADVKATLTEEIKKNTIKANASSYASYAFYKKLEANTLEIYDPLFELKFRNSYTDYYELISTDNANIGKNIIFKYNDTEYTVEQFYKTASNIYASSIITDYFQLEYALSYSEEFLDDDTVEDNTDALNQAIKNFESNKNSTYPSAAGLETFLLASYGYPTKDQVLKYHYNAQACLTAYKGKVLFDEWATSEHAISDDAKKVLNQILTVGNAQYEKLFSMDVDHILINIDYNADGKPDDPEKFLAKLDASKQELFKSEVEKLIQAIYTEANYEAYEDNTLYERLAYIVSEYNKGSALLSNPSDNWDNYKTNFNFMLTAEQLASSGDITQDSVSNFVTPFADYLKEMYNIASNDSDLKLDDNGNFFTTKSGKLDSASDVNSITFDSLCATVYGYHLIVLNEYDGPDSLKFTQDNDSNGYQSKIQVLISEDEDDEANNVYVETNSYNENTDSASLNQLFIYYVQLKNNDDSSLDSNIESLMASLFSDAINVYSSNNFQTALLLNTLKIKSTDFEAVVKAEKNFYANQVTEYDEDSEYASWVSESADWARPNQK